MLWSDEAFFTLFSDLLSFSGGEMRPKTATNGYHRGK